MKLITNKAMIPFQKSIENYELLNFISFYGKQQQRINLLNKAGKNVLYLIYVVTHS